MTAVPVPATRVRPALTDARVATLAAALLATAFLATQVHYARVPFGPNGSVRDFRIGLLHCLLAAYLPFAVGRVLGGGDLAAATAGRPPAEMRPGRALLVAAAGVGLVAAFFGPYLMEPELGGPLHWWAPSGWNPGSAWHRVLGLWVGPWGVLLACAVVVVSWRLHRLARAVTLADAFDRAPLAPFVAPALANAGLAVGTLSLYAAFALDFGAARPVLVNAALSATLALVALLLPTASLRTRIRAAKAAELEWCERALAAERAALRGAPRPTATAAEPGGRLADLLAYRGLVERVADWPFDNPALRRIALYLLLPAGSCLASTLGQELVQRWLLRR